LSLYNTFILIFNYQSYFESRIFQALTKSATSLRTVSLFSPGLSTSGSTTLPVSPPNEPERRLLSITPAGKSANSGAKKNSGKSRPDALEERTHDEDNDEGDEMAAVEMARSSSSGSQVRFYAFLHFILIILPRALNP
jgi:hypothetical protein